MDNLTSKFLSDADLGPSTKSAYSAALKMFNDAGLTIDANCLKAFYKYLAKVKRAGRGGKPALLSPSSVALYISALRACMRWLQANEHITYEVYNRAILKFQVEKKPRYKSQSAVRIPAEGMHKAIGYYDTLPLPEDKLERMATLRNRALMWVLWDTAGRVSECLQLTRTNTNNGTLNRVTITGKGDKARSIHLGAESMRAIAAYLSERDDDMDALFIPLRHPSRENESLSRVGAWRIVTHAARSVGLTGNIGPHMIRHAKATMLTNEGMRVEVLQKYLGHESPATTMRHYAHLTDKSVALEVYEYAVHPNKMTQ